MRLCKLHARSGRPCAGVVIGESVRPFDWEGAPALCDILHAADPERTAQALLERATEPVPLAKARLLPPIDRQEVWAAGVTYKRSREARERESAGAARFYDLVYTAARPELFFKANPHRVVGTGEPLHIRRDSQWSVPEPELALVLSPALSIVGCTIGNDMSARDIEGENPLYLPQAKVHDRCCALGPVVTLAAHMPPPADIRIELRIERSGRAAFQGATSIAAMARSFEDLVSWLGREATFPDGVVLLTGTGVVPPDDFTLLQGDRVTIEIAGIGKLENVIEHRQGK